MRRTRRPQTCGTSTTRTAPWGMATPSCSRCPSGGASCSASRYPARPNPTPTTPAPTLTLTLTLTKVFSQTGEQKNLWNALKYSTAFPLVYAGYLRKTAPSACSKCTRAARRPRGRHCSRAPPRPPGLASEPGRRALAAWLPKRGALMACALALARTRRPRRR